MRSYAVIPPLMLDSRQRRLVFNNENGALIDMETEFKVRRFRLYRYLLIHFVLIQNQTTIP